MHTNCNNKLCQITVPLPLTGVLLARLLKACERLSLPKRASGYCGKSWVQNQVGLGSRPSSATHQLRDLEPVILEINEEQPRKRSLFKLAVAGESATITCILQRGGKAAEGWEASQWKRKEGCSCALIGGCWPGEAVGWINQIIGYGCIFGFLCLALGWKWGQKLEKLSVIKSQ